MDKKVSGVSMNTLLDSEEDEDYEDEIAKEAKETKVQEFNIHGLDDAEEDEEPVVQNVFIPEEEIHDDIHEIRCEEKRTHRKIRTPQTDVQSRHRAPARRSEKQSKKEE